MSAAQDDVTLSGAAAVGSKSQVIQLLGLNPNNEVGSSSGQSAATLAAVAPNDVSIADVAREKFQAADEAAAATALAPTAVTDQEPASPDSVHTEPPPLPPAASLPSAATTMTTAATVTPAPATGADESLQPLSPPDPSEGVEVAAEYKVYLQRWEAGTTLAQRWHRLRVHCKLQPIQEEWEDWQQDLLLEQIRQQINCKAANNSKVNSSSNNNKNRRGRADAEEAAEAAPEPRRVRSRRAPTSLQDYHVDAPASASPDRQDVQPSAAAGAAFYGGMYEQPEQQQFELYPPVPANWGNKQLQQRVPARNSNRNQQQQQPFDSRSIAASMRPPRSQPQQQQPAAASAAAMSEMMETVHKMAASLSAAAGSQGAGGAAGLLANPAAFKAFVAVMSQHTNNPAGIVQQMAAILASQQQQHLQ